MSKLFAQGAAGADVKELQAALNYHVRGPATPLSPDGIFGPLTDARTREFQKAACLIADGLIGPKTLGLLYRRVVGTSEIHLTPIGPKAPDVTGRRTLLPARGFGVGGLPFLPTGAPTAAPPAPPKPKKSQTKFPKSTGFDVKSQLVLDPLADGKESPKVQYKITIMHELPWPIFVPKPAKLTFDFKSSPFTPEYSISGKLKVPFTELRLPPIGLYKSGSLTPYFFTGAGVKQDGFDKLKTKVGTGVGAAVNIKLIELPHRPFLPTVSLSADGGYQYDINLGDRTIGGKGFLKGIVGLEWHLP